MIADLWHAPTDHKSAIGTATTGSSEAIMLGGMAMKRRWQEKMKAKGKSIHEPGPNIVMGAEAQVALEKFARYFEVDMRLVPVTKEVRTLLSVVVYSSRRCVFDEEAQEAEGCLGTRYDKGA